MRAIRPRELVELRGSGSSHALFDVRELGEAEAGHIFGATYLPRRRIELRISELVPVKSTTLVVYDEGSGRAELAAQTLEELGFSDVAFLEGGLPGWAESGEPVSTGSNVPSKKFGEEICESAHTPSVAAVDAARWREEEQGVLFCDIRTPEEYETARIPGAFRTAGFDVALTADVLKSRDTRIVVNCAGRTRSIIACETLRRLGLDNVYALENGTMGWVLADHQLEKGEARGPIEPTEQSRSWARGRASELAASVGVERVPPEKVKDWLRQREEGRLNLYAFDVRQVPEYEAGHIVGTAALPGALAVQRTDEFVAVRSAQILLVDDDETRALLTGYWLKMMGIDGIAVLEGGISNWVEAGNELTKGRERRRSLGIDEARRRARAVSPSQLPARMADGATRVIDVGTSRDFEARHLPGSTWIPRGWLELRVAAEVPDRTTPILVVARDDTQSVFAAGSLSRLGYENVTYLAGGLAAAADLATETGLPSGANSAKDVILPPYAQGVDGMKRYLEWEKRLTGEAG